MLLSLRALVISRSALLWALPFLALFGTLTSCVPVSQQSGGAASQTSDEYYAEKILRTDDYTYIDDVRTVKFYAESDKIQDVLNPPLQSIDQEFDMVLEFDLLRPDAIRCEARLLLCNSDWTVADLLPIQYLNEINQFYITDVMVSNSTRTPYWHYKFRMPKVKLPGNYLLVVTGPGGAEDYILTRRCLIYDNQLLISAETKFGYGTEARFSHQQVDFTIAYPNLEIINPQQQIKVVLRQNYRWDNAKTNLYPTFVREAQRRLEYMFFNGENAFLGGNEFRAFNMRALTGASLNVERIDPNAEKFQVYVIPDKSRRTDVYSQEFDINGQFVVGNQQYGGGDTNGDYANVHFTLKTPEVPGNVYVFGGLTDWKTDNRYLLKYDAAKQAYTGAFLLKQAYYNYIYVQRPSANSGEINETIFEGSHNQTENIYDILVYYRAPGQRADMLIGYYQSNFFGR